MRNLFYTQTLTLHCSILNKKSWCTFESFWKHISDGFYWLVLREKNRKFKGKLQIWMFFLWKVYSAICSFFLWIQQNILHLRKEDVWILQVTVSSKSGRFWMNCVVNKLPVLHSFSIFLHKNWIKCLNHRAEESLSAPQTSYE